MNKNFKRTAYISIDMEPHYSRTAAIAAEVFQIQIQIGSGFRGHLDLDPDSDQKVKNVK